MCFESSLVVGTTLLFENIIKNSEKITTVTSDYPKPIVSRYKFIKGFENSSNFDSSTKFELWRACLKSIKFFRAWFWAKLPTAL